MMIWSEYKAQLTAKLSDRAHLESRYDAIAAVMTARSPSAGVVLSFNVTRIATLAKQAVSEGRMSRADAAAEMTRAFIDGHELWREQNPSLAAEMDRSAMRARQTPKKSAPPRDPAAKRAEEANVARIARLSGKASPASPARRADAGPALAAPPPPVAPPAPALAPYHAARAKELRIESEEYRRHFGPMALQDPASALTAEARAHCKARGLDPSIFAERASNTPADRRRYLTPDWH